VGYTLAAGSNQLTSIALPPGDENPLACRIRFRPSSCSDSFRCRRNTHL